MSIVKSVQNTFARTQVINDETMNIVSLNTLISGDGKKSKIRGLIVSLESNDAVIEQLATSEQTARNLDNDMIFNGTRVLATGTRKGNLVTITKFHVIGHRNHHMNHMI